MKKYNETMRYAARCFGRGVRVMAALDLTAARSRAQALQEAVRADREALAAHALAGTGTADELTALRDRIAQNAQTVNDLMGAIGAEEGAQRARVATQFARRMDGALADARGGYFRAMMAGTMPDAQILAALSLPITTAANPGNGLLPVTVSDQLIGDLYQDGALLAEITVTQLAGLRLPKITGTLSTSDAANPAGNEANSVALESETINFGRFEQRDKIEVPDAVLRGTNTALDAYITAKLHENHRDRMLRRMFATSASGDYAHMSVYNAAVGVKSVTEATMLDAIFAALADLPASVRTVAKVAMTPKAWFGLIKGLTNGAATLFGKPDEATLGFAVVLCDYATTPIVGDLRTIHVNYDDPIALASAQDVDKGFTKVVLSADYDIHVEDAGRLRLVKTTA